MDEARQPSLAPGKLPGPLLERLVSAHRTRPDASVLVSPGYGRGAAAIAVDGGQVLVKSDPITFATDAAARYLVAVNANDIACLGGIPRWLTVVLLLPERSTTEPLVEGLFAELRAACDADGISVIGGHSEITVGVDRPLLIGTMLGIPGPSGLLEPGGASPGDDLLVTKWIGIEGTALLARERRERLIPVLGEATVTAGAKLLRQPGISIVRDARAALSVAGVTALHDPTEGGVATAIHELATVSGSGTEIMAEAMPVLPETAAICDQLDLDPLGLLGSGALLMAVSPDRRQAIEAACDAAGIMVSHIGRLVDAAEGVAIVRDGRRQPLPRFDTDEVARGLQAATPNDPDKEVR
jgi:hydrogenase maturation factor